MKPQIRNEVKMIFLPQNNIKTDYRTGLNEVVSRETSGIWVELDCIIHEGGHDYVHSRKTDIFISNN